MNGYQIVSEAIFFKPQAGEKLLSKFRGAVSLYINGKLAFKKKYIITPRIRITNQQLFLDNLSSFLIIPLPPWFYISWRYQKDIPVPYQYVSKYGVMSDGKRIDILIDNKDSEIIISIQAKPDNIELVRKALKEYSKAKEIKWTVSK